MSEWVDATLDLDAVAKRGFYHLPATLNFSSSASVKGAGSTHFFLVHPNLNSKQQLSLALTPASYWPGISVRKLLSISAHTKDEHGNANCSGRRGGTHGTHQTPSPEPGCSISC